MMASALRAAGGKCCDEASDFACGNLKAWATHRELGDLGAQIHDGNVAYRHAKCAITRVIDTLSQVQVP